MVMCLYVVLWSVMAQSVDEQLVLDNVVSIMEHSVTHLADPTDVFLVQVETDVVELMLNGPSPVSL